VVAAVARHGCPGGFGAADAVVYDISPADDN